MKKKMKKTRSASAPKSARPQMPGYGLPENEKGLLPWKWAELRLRKSHNYWITTVKPDGSPHVMVVWGLWLAELFSSARAGNRARREIWLKISAAWSARKMRRKP